MLFFASGAVSLVYEVVWTRRLNVMLGSAAPAAATVLAAFLGGLGIGAEIAGRMRPRRPLLWYGVLEAVLAVAGGTSWHWLGLLERWQGAFPAGLDQPWILLGLRAATSLAALLVPAALMGATLPLLLRHVSGSGASALPLLYGINTVGAVAGCLLAGFVLVARLGESTTLVSAAIINAVIGMVAIAAGARTTTPVEEAAAPRPLGARPLGLSFAAGFLTLALELVWFRILATTVGGSAQAFALMLSSFLAGLAWGAFGVGRRRIPDPGRLLGDNLLRVGLTAALFLPACAALPGGVLWVLRHTESLERIGLFLGAVMALGMGYGTVALGTSLPLLVLDCGRHGHEGPRTTGSLYAASAAGSLSGSLATGFVLIPTLGLDGCSVLAAAIASFTAVKAAGRPVARFAIVIVLLSLAAPALYRHPAGLYVTGTYAYAHLQIHGDTPPPRPGVHPFPRYASLSDPGRPRFVPRDPPSAMTRWIWRRDGLSASVAVGEAGTVRSLVINGKTDASSFGAGDMRTQLMLGHLPALLRRADGGRALCIGLGSGTTLTALSHHPFAELWAAEVEPAVVEAAAAFAALGGGVPARPGVELMVEDGRQLLAREHGSFDVITSEPSNLWMAGVAHLFTREFFVLARERLAPGGMFCQWIHLYQIAEDDVRVLLRTLLDVFPEVALFCDGPDLLVLAGEADAFASPDAVARRFAAEPVRRHLSLGHFPDVASLLLTYLGDGNDARAFAGTGALNTDDHPLLEFRATKSLLRDDAAAIVARLEGAAQSSRR